MLVAENIQRTDTESMSTPSKYEAATRLVDDPDRLRELYHERGLSIRQIAQNYADVGRTRVSEALREHGIQTDATDEGSLNANDGGEDCESDRGTDPPARRGSESRVTWSRVT